MEWFRWHHGCVTDPKFQFVARRSGQNAASVLAVWAALLERASQAQDRGSVAGFDCESVDALFGLEDGACRSILTAFEAKGMIAGERVTKWDARQSKDETSAERKRLQREREKLSQEVTDGHARSPRSDKIREEKKNAESGKDSDARACGGGALPGLEFLELRRFYDEHARSEAPLTGFAEYKQLCAARCWPGQGVIYDALEKHGQADPEGWKRFAPGLARFLREHWWEKTPAPRASPGAGDRPFKTFEQRAAEQSWADFEEIQRRKEAAREAASG